MRTLLPTTDHVSLGAGSLATLDCDLRLSHTLNRSAPPLGDRLWCPDSRHRRSKTHNGFVPNLERLPSFGRIETTTAQSSNGVPLSSCGRGDSDTALTNIGKLSRSWNRLGYTDHTHLTEGRCRE